jgi:hypothetical protein
MVSKIPAKDRGAKRDDAEIGAARSAPLPSAGLNKNIILIIYLTGPKIHCGSEFRVPDGVELAASRRTQQPPWLVNHD